MTPPEFLYHGTASRFLDAILQEGLRPQSRLYVHLSPNTETAVKVGKRHALPSVLKVCALDYHKDGGVFYRSENGVWLTKTVPVEYLIQL